MALLSIVIISYGFWNASNQNSGWSQADPTGRTLKEISFAYTISDFNPDSSGFLRALAEKNVSNCFVPKIPLNTSQNFGLPMEAAAEYRDRCSTFSLWVDQRFSADYFEYLVLNPKKVISSLTTLFIGSFAFIGDGKTMTPIPDIFSNTLFLNFFGISKYSFASLFVIFLFSFTIYSRSQRKLQKAFWHKSNFIPVFLFASLMTSVVASNLLLPTHLGELSRVNHTCNLFLRILVLWQILELIIMWCRNSTIKIRINK
jgi:hypothetical protein